MKKRRLDQAVIVIHGIGEQKPMSTLRKFVDALLPDPPQAETTQTNKKTNKRYEIEEKYFSKPDSLSELFELRKLQNRTQPRTHFYEYYWAYKVKGTTFTHIRNWLSSLLLRLPWKVPSHLRVLWGISWILMVLGITFWAIFLAGETTIFTGVSAFWSAVWMTVILGGLQGLIIHFVGDAARYLSPRPQNINLRQEIRADGVRLLRKLHDSGEYERIMVVGHSLGSVIAYDILKHYWQEIHLVYNNPSDHNQNALIELERVGLALQSDSQNIDVSEYRKSQIKLWWELDELKNPWLVTDFITLGSPLAHASLLLAQDEKDLKSRQRQRELPTCPPVQDKDHKGIPHYAFDVWEKYTSNKGEHKLKALHHAAPFAVTRWTNLYFPTRWGIFGDFVGGSLKKWFGKGINDISVSTHNKFRNYTPWAHTAYWRKPKKGKTDQALDELRKSLDLNGSHTFKNRVDRSRDL